MALSEEFERSGSVLFRWRGLLPATLTPLLLLALTQAEVIERHFGDVYQGVWEVMSLLVCLAGLVMRCHVAGHSNLATSGRNTTRQLAEKLNTTGMYSVVRHPLYLGNFLIMLGMTIFTQVWWLIIMCALLFVLYYERIMFAEEAFLRRQFGDEFLDWASRTPAMVPDFRRYVPPRRVFLWRNVLRREYTTQFQIFGGLLFVDVASDLLAERRWEVDTPWAVAGALSLIVYLVLRWMKRSTQLLTTPKEAGLVAD